jgi:hypothetical protein
MSSIPIQDKKARAGLWISAISRAVERDSHAPLIAPFNILIFSRELLGNKKGATWRPRLSNLYSLLSE